jgi:hypothetical protein
MTQDNKGNPSFEQEDVDLLIARYNDGSATPAERALVESWYIRGEFKGELQVVEQLLKDQVHSRELLIRHMNPVKTTRLWPKFPSRFGTSRITVAAAVVALISLCIYFFNPFRSDVFNSTTSLYENDVTPGTRGATITLSNGKTIELSGTKSGVVVDPTVLTYDDGSAVDPRDSDLSQDDKNSYSPQLTATTARGFTYTLTLADGTKVWLNAASTIKFPVSFAGLVNRTISLSGEAYFEVAKDKKHPFIVESRGQKVQVLGTHFNINSYEDQKSIKTTLLEGHVQVFAQEGMQNVILEPGQQATQTGSKEIKVDKVDVNEAVDWKNGDFIFNNESLASIMKRVARWYDVEVVYQEGVNVNQTFGGKVSRSKNISAVLSSIQSTGKIKFKIEGNKIIVGVK